MLRKLGLDDEEAFTFFQELKNVAVANLIVRFESKLDVRNAKLDARDAKLDARDAKLDALRWVIGVGLAGLGILLTLFRMLG